MCSGGVLSLQGPCAASDTAARAAVERSIRAVRARRLTALAAAALALAWLSAAPAFAGPGELELQPLSRHPAARAAARRGPTVSAVLQSLLRRGEIGEAIERQYLSAYVAAKRSLGRLGGTRRAELGAVIANVQAMAAAGTLSSSRAPVVFLTLERNRQWWTREPLLSSGERVSLRSSKLVWQYYPGQGLEIQWLGTFGKANGYYLSGHENGNLRTLLSEALPLASKRAGGIAWEYMFRFDGGQPPWTSGLSQGTALQVLSRAYSRFGDPAYLSAAQQSLAVFQAAPPLGVRVRTPAGALYAEYTYAPGDKILNGFIQALVGLYDYASITKDPLGLRLFEEGDAEARAEVPHYDTGAWSLYDQYGESNLNYHELLTEFLQHLCDRTRKGPPFTPGAPTTTTTTTTTTGTTTTPPPSTGAPGGGTSPTGGASASTAETPRAAASQTSSGIPGDDVYCTTAKRFTGDLSTPPAVALLTKKLRGGRRAGVQLSLSKISKVSLIVRRAGRVVWRNSATVERGKPRLLWVTPAKGGSFDVTLTASDLAGNFATAAGTIVVTRH
jgi:hypothetical protein